MSLLYSYMTGNEYSMQMKTIDGVLINTTEMYGSLQGIAGSSAIVHIESLELPEDIEEESE
jgi:hypothetical protein